MPLLRKMLGVQTFRELLSVARGGFNSYWNSVIPQPPPDPNAPPPPPQQPGILDRRGGMLGTGYFDAVASGAIDPNANQVPQAPQPPQGPQPPPIRQDARHRQAWYERDKDDMRIYRMYDAHTGEQITQGTDLDINNYAKKNGYEFIEKRYAPANYKREKPGINVPPHLLSQDANPQQQAPQVGPPQPVEFRNPLPSPPPITMAQAEDFVRDSVTRGYIMQGDPIEVLGIWDAAVQDRTDPRAALPLNRGDAEVFARTASTLGFRARVYSRGIRMPPDWIPKENFFVVVDPYLVEQGQAPPGPGSSIGEPAPLSDARTYTERMGAVTSHLQLMLDFIDVGQIDDANNHLMRAKGVVDSFDNPERDALERLYPATYQALGQLSHASTIAEDPEWRNKIAEAIEHWKKGAKLHEAPPRQAYATQELYGPTPQPDPVGPPPSPPPGAPPGGQPSDDPIIPLTWEAPPPPADIPRAKRADVEIPAGKVTFEKISGKAYAVFIGTTKVGEVIKVKGSIKEGTTAYYELYTYPQAPPGLKVLHGQAIGGTAGWKGAVEDAIKAGAPDSRASDSAGLQNLSLSMMAALRGYLECVALSEQQREAELAAADAELEANIAHLRNIFGALSRDDGYWLSTQMGPVYQLMRTPAAHWDSQTVMNAIVFLENLASQAPEPPAVEGEKKKTWAG